MASRKSSPLGVLTERTNNTNNANNSKKAVPAILNRKRKAESPIDMTHFAPSQPSSVMDVSCYENMDSTDTENNPLPNRPSLKAAQPGLRDRVPLSSLEGNNKLKRKSVTIPPKAKKIKMRKSWSQFREFIRTSTSPTSSPAGSPSSSPLRNTDDISALQEATSAFAHARGPAPFPTLKWADRDQVWRLICKKETGMYERKTQKAILGQNPALMPRMRAILLDWIIEVCEVYRLHRETFYLAVDFIDRYLSQITEMPKTRLQLIGVTCLFIGAKIEEIYPPKLSEFAYVTDGACSEEEILGMELVLLKELNWGLSPMTPNAWMKMFMQVSNCDKSPNNETFVIPQYSGLPFARVMQVLDLCMLDMASLSYRYSVLATAALAHTFDRQVALEASGYHWSDVQPCFEWMSAFVGALREDAASPAPTKTFHNVSAENQHNIQGHTVELSTLDQALDRLAHAQSRKSPTPSGCGILDVLMTPPEDEGDVSKAFQYAAMETPKGQSTSKTAASVFMSPDTPTTTNANFVMKQ